MRPSSAKAKGRMLQQAVRDLLLASEEALGPRDIESTAMGVNGADIKLSTAAFSHFPFSIECKNIAAFQGFKFMEQAREHSDRDGGIPMAVVKANGQNPIMMMDLEDFIDLIQTSKEALNGNQ